MPLHTIITAAKTVSRASSALPAGAAIMTETISATSITVTATAKTSVPNGSPVRCATTSAWYTAANTVGIRAAPETAAIRPPPPEKGVTSRTIQAAVGHAQVHQGVRVFALAMPIVPLFLRGDLVFARCFSRRMS